MSTSELTRPGRVTSSDQLSASGEGTEKMGMFHALRYRDFQLLWFGNLGTAIASWIQLTALSWVTYDLTNSGAMLGAVNSMRTVPALVLSLCAGAAADRFNRKGLVAGSQLVLFTSAFLLAVDLAVGTVQAWHLFPFVFIVSAAQAFNMPVRQTMVFDVVPLAVVPNAVAVGNLANSLSRTLGSAGAGALIVAFGSANSFFAQAAAYVVVLGTVVFMRSPYSETRPAARPQTSVRDALEGYSYAIRNPLARLQLVLMAIWPLFLIPLHLALLPIFARDVVGGGATSLGLMFGAIGAGGLLGGLITAALNNVDRRGLLQLEALLVFGLAHAGVCVGAAVTGQVWATLPFLVLAGASEAVYSTTNQTVLQLLAPVELRGRLTSTLQLATAMMPIGILVAGSLADVFGAVAVGITLSLIACAITLVLLVGSPGLRELRVSRLAEVRDVGLRQNAAAVPTAPAT